VLRVVRGERGDGAGDERAERGLAFARGDGRVRRDTGQGRRRPEPRALAATRRARGGGLREPLLDEPFLPRRVPAGKRRRRPGGIVIGIGIGIGIGIAPLRGGGVERGAEACRRRVALARDLRRAPRVASDPTRRRDPARPLSPPLGGAGGVARCVRRFIISLSDHHPERLERPRAVARVAASGGDADERVEPVRGGDHPGRVERGGERDHAKRRGKQSRGRRRRRGGGGGGALGGWRVRVNPSGARGLVPRRRRRRREERVFDGGSRVGETRETREIRRGVETRV
jgi:hypothetical protein